MDGWLGVVIMVALGVGFAGVMIGLSLLLGPKNPTPEKLAPYECGIVPSREPPDRFPVSFYIVAMLFVMFDIEIVFMYPWAVVYRDAIRQSSVIFWSMLSFITILMVGYAYAVKKGALDFKR